MKDQMIADEELFGDFSWSKRGIAGEGDGFKWETAYRELAQSQSLQRQREKRLREGEGKRREGSTTPFDSAAGPSVNVPGQGFGGVDRGITARSQTEAALQPAQVRREAPAADRANELVRINEELRSEIAERKRMEAALQSAYAELEKGAADRANELVRAGEELRSEIAECKRTEAALQSAYAELEKGAADRVNELVRAGDELRSEIAERRRTEEALRAAQEEQEARAADRMSELVRAGDELRSEIAERRRTEETLQSAYAELEKGAADRENELVRAGDELQSEIAERKKAEEQLQHTLDHFQTIVGATIQVMGSVVEIKDPFAAGHHFRSAALARNIARLMGLSRDQINAVRMAGSIHDIGKLSVPAEILSKPGKLSDAEFQLVKEHAGRGYEMLRDVDFPWPLADIVHQHHERMDGSGYPRRMTGGDIRIEARIMAVADVVEAMVSHRPYRPALGIEAALAEIETNSGTLYDSAIVDACLQLFREKGFQFAEA